MRFVDDHLIMADDTRYYVHSGVLGIFPSPDADEDYPDSIGYGADGDLTSRDLSSLDSTALPAAHRIEIAQEMIAAWQGLLARAMHEQSEEARQYTILLYGNSDAPQPQGSMRT